MRTAVTEPPQARNTRRHDSLETAAPDKERKQDGTGNSPAAPQLESAPQDNSAVIEEVQSSETLLQRLLRTTERLAQATELARRKWQAAALAAIAIAAAVTTLAIWTYVSSIAVQTSQASLLLENHELAGKMESANQTIAELTRKTDLLTDQNIRLVTENSRLKVQTPAPPPVAAERTQAPVTQVAGNKEPTASPSKPRPVKLETQPARLEQDRLNSIRRGNYPPDTTRGELVAVLGKPDRTYRMGEYEQLLYFDRTPGRFWFSSTQKLYAAR